LDIIRPNEACLDIRQYVHPRNVNPVLKKFGVWVDA